jgi:hypothetical protein
MKGAKVSKGHCGSGRYEIRIRGHLDGRWADWFGGMTMALEDNGDTTMTGPIVDQAALHGMLKKVRDLGIPLLSVNCIGDDNTLIQRKDKEMTSERKTAIIVGVLYIVGTVSGFLSLVLTGPLREAQDLLAGVAADGAPIVLGALAVLTMGLVLAMVPVMMFPILKKKNEVLALGYVVFRGALETIAYLATAAGWLLLLPLSQAYRVGAPDAGSLRAIGALLLDAKEIGSIGTIVFCLGASMFYFLLYRSRLVPRWLSTWGLLAVIPYFAGGVLSLAHLLDPLSMITTVLDVPMAVQEMVLAVWLIAKGFNPIAFASYPAKQT